MTDRFGLHSEEDKKYDLRFKEDNICTVSDDGIQEKCDTEDTHNRPDGSGGTSISSYKCYEQIQKQVQINSKIKNNLKENPGVEKCINILNKNLRCNGEDNYLKCPNKFNEGDNPIKNSCINENIAMENIINYCIDSNTNPSSTNKDLCNKVYNEKRFPNVSKNSKLDEFKDTDCGDNCNYHKTIDMPSVQKYTYKNNLKSTSNNLSCPEMSKLLYNCDKLKKDNDAFQQQYHNFIKDGDFDYDKLMSNDPNFVDKLAKYGMCKIASDNIDIIRGSQIDMSLTTWWNYNIFNNKKVIGNDSGDDGHETGFQRNIFYVSFFIVLFLKLTILSKFNVIPGTKTYLNKLLPILSIIFSLIIFYGFINNLNWVAKLAHLVFLVFIIAIISGFGFYIKDKIWSKDESSKQIIALLLIVGCIILFTKGLSGPSDNNTFVSVSIILYFIFISAFFILKSEKSTIIFKMISILIIALLLVIYLFYSKDLLFNAIYFYIFVFIILIFIICTNNTDMFSKKFNGDNVSKYVKIINIVLKPFKSTNKMDSSEKAVKFLVLGFYFIFAFADSFISVLSPQVSLVIMIVFRLILNRWFEPINAIFASLCGYSMTNLEGTHERLTTTNRGILDIENLLSFFVN